MQQYKVPNDAYQMSHDEDDAKGIDKDIKDDWTSMMKKMFIRGRR